MKIEDGTGKQLRLKVDSAFRAHTYSVSINEQTAATDRADSYNVNSGTVAVTTSDEQGILYLKNNEARNLRVDAIVAMTGVSTAGTENLIKVYKNPTTGTLISEANEADTVSNRNFGSTLTLTSDAYKGDGSSTVTDGSVHIESLTAPSNTRTFFEIDEILTQGDSIAITFEISSNTACNCIAAIACHLEDPNL